MRNALLRRTKTLAILLSLIIAAVAGLAVLGSPAVGGQSQNIQLYSAVENQNGLDQTPTAQSRLALLRQLPSTGQIQLVRLNQAAVNRDQFAVALSGHGNFTFSKSAGEILDTHEFTWIAGPDKNKLREATLVVRDGEVTGSLVTPAGAYRIMPLDGTVQAIVQVNASALPRDEPESFSRRESNSLPPAPPTTYNPGGDVAPTEIDVLVAYTPAAKAKVGNMDSQIALAIAETNQSYVSSQVHIHLNLLDSFEFAYSEKNKGYDAILDDFVKNTDVNNRRDKAGADLAALIVDQPDWCGLSDAIMAKASSAFSIVYFDCAIAPRYSLAHEFGHLMGARHEPAGDPTPGYAHGYQYIGPNISWRTIMAYDCLNGCQRLPYWSSPRIKYQNAPMGTAARYDNARVLNQTASTVAAFRDRP